MNIKFKDIEAIITGLCYANTLLDAKIEELNEKGFDKAVMAYRGKKEQLKESINAITKIRKELHLKDDYAYKQVFSE